MKTKPIVLALDTSHQRGSVAVSRGEEILSEILFDASDTHSATLLPGVEACLAAAKVALSDIELFAVVYGPGSFTGLRIALATVKAFAAVRRMPVAPVESCAVLAAAFPYVARPVLTLIDARRGEVYGALYETADGLPRGIVPLFSAKPEAIGEILAKHSVTGPLILCGTGALRHRAALEALVPCGSRFAGERWAVPSASLCALIALERTSLSYDEIFALEPFYIRPPDARLPDTAGIRRRGGRDAVTEAKIREMIAGDIPSVMEIERASFITPWTEGMFRSQLRFRDRAINLVLVEDGTVVGYAAAWVAYDEMHILSIAVVPAVRRRGHGGEILRAVMERGRTRGAVRAVLEVREGNSAARAFYRIHGFVDIGTRRRYYSDTDEDAIIMEYLFGE